MSTSKSHRSKPSQDAFKSYGCQEFRDDAERILTSRFDSHLESRYEAHRATCFDCRRFHHRLMAVYRGPVIETRIKHDAVHRDQQFSQIFARTQQYKKRASKQRQASEPRFPSFVRPLALAGVGALGLALGWSTMREIVAPDKDPSTIEVAAKAEGPAPAPKLAQQTPEANYPSAPSLVGTAPETDVDSALGHRSQRFGRVIGGNAKLARQDARTASPGTFRVGTTIATAENESVQFALSGKMLVSLTGNSRLTWSQASQDKISLKLDRGMMAVRYDRKPGEPTLLVHSRSALVKVVGTVFTVEMLRSGDTSVSVLRGKVQVKGRSGAKHLANVNAGSRFDTASARLSHLGAHEVAAALPLSDNSAQHEGDEAVAQIPAAWTVAGLPKARRLRTLSRIPSRNRLASSRLSRKRRAAKHRPRASTPGLEAPVQVPSTSEALERHAIKELVEQSPSTAPAAPEKKQRQALSKEVQQAKDHCTQLYNDPATRFLAANCLQSFLKRYPNHPRARAQALVAIGILRMDYARDHQRAIHAFESFLKDYSNHRQAELVRYRLVLANIESGDIQGALSAAKSYVRRFPNGPHLGHVIQRFPELKSML